MAEIDWKPVSERPEWDNQPGRQFIRLEGSRDHSGLSWGRIHCGLAYIRKPGEPDELKGYREIDILQLCEDGDMDLWSAEVTHWAPASFSAPVSSGVRESK